MFIQLLKKYPTSRVLTATKLMLAKSYFELGDYRAASIVCDNFMKIHKTSSYLDDMHFLRGELFFQAGRYIKAVEEWLWVGSGSSDTRLKNKAAEYVYKTVSSKLSEGDIKRLGKKHKGESFAGLVEIVQATRLIESGRREEGIRRLEKFIEQNPYHLYADTARQLIQQGSGANVSGKRILLLKSSLPQNKPVSDGLADGFFYAAHEMRTRNPEKSIQIDTLTLRPGVLPALKSTLSQVNKTLPLAIVGPLDTDVNAALALYSKYERIPFIMPLSSQNGLAELSNFAFQINPDAGIKGQFLGEYATAELGYKTFAVLAPADNYGQEIVQSFEEAVTSNGGEVVETQWYYEDTKDLSRQFKAIRKKGFYITFRDSVRAADTTLAEEEIQEQFRQYMTDVLFSEESVRGSVDSTQIPSTGIDALFIAVYSDFIPYIAPQFAFHNIQCALLGSEGWNDPEQLIQQRAYLDGLVYVSAGFYDQNSWNYRQFASRFRQQYKTTPEFFHLLGYDIGKWLIKNYQPRITRQELRDRLDATDPYQGILENISFERKPRVNSQLNIVRFYLGQILKVK